MDEIAYRIFGWLFIEVFMHFVCFGIGWILLKILTLGKYPTKETDEKIVIYIGLGALISLLIAFTIYAYIYF